MQIYHEEYGPLFHKWHLNSPWAPSPEFPDHCRPVIHGLEVDLGTPHDHPWDFHTFVLCGGYEEEWFYVEDGVWKMQLLQMRPGESRFVPHNHVHRVARLLDGPCRTIALYGPHVRDWSYYPQALEALA